jgi:hypothetical protein
MPTDLYTVYHCITVSLITTSLPLVMTEPYVHTYILHTYLLTYIHTYIHWFNSYIHTYCCILHWVPTGSCGDIKWATAATVSDWSLGGSRWAPGDRWIIKWWIENWTEQLNSRWHWFFIIEYRVSSSSSVVSVVDHGWFDRRGADMTVDSRR